MLTKFTIIFNVSTTPENLARSRVHTGGWSETHWWPSETLGEADIGRLLDARAALLPATGTIVGYRRSNFEPLGNKLLAKGSSTATRSLRGSNVVTDLPQVSLMLSVTTGGGINTTRLTLRCIPDDVMVGGEYKGTDAFNRKLSIYMRVVALEGWGFIGRDLSLPVLRVVSIVGQIIKLTGNIGAGVGTFIRLLKVRDVQGKPVTGSYPVVDVNAVGEYTLSGLPIGTNVSQSGLARVDEVKFFDASAVEMNRAVVRKIGRPSESYRGRSSRRRR